MQHSLKTFLNGLLPAFSRDSWEKVPAALGRLEPGTLAKLPTLAKLLSCIERGGIPLEDIQVVNAQTGFVSHRYVTAPDGSPAVNRIQTQMNAGNSVAFYRLPRRIDQVADACAVFTEVFQYASGCNAYWSPPLAQGLPTHIDAHDVFVVQVSGTKSWAIYPEAIRFPTPRQAGVVRPTTPPLFDCELSPGDVLYLPAGFPHFAITGADSDSLHLTFGIHKPTVLDAAIEMLRAAADQDQRLNWPVRPTTGRSIEEMAEVVRAAASDEQRFRSALQRSLRPSKEATP